MDGQRERSRLKIYPVINQRTTLVERIGGTNSVSLILNASIDKYLRDTMHKPILYKFPQDI